uniref:Guanylate cyclase domain-containing protein n=1 Tax=Ditylum brightwellii TaxID=49249 RepID=A0A7S4RWS7_9STRA
MAALHVGNNERRREFLVLGNPIDQVSAAEGIAQSGQLAASPEAMSILSKSCTLKGSFSSSNPTVIACRNKRYFEPNPDFQVLKKKPKPWSDRIRHLSRNAIGALRHEMSLYVHPAARAIASSSAQNSRSIIADAEIRSVYTIFVKPIIDARIHGTKSGDDHLFALLNDIMGITCKVLEQFRGHLRQFVVDDKGVVLIATFGQRGATFPNLVAEKGLPCTIAIHDALKINLDIGSQIGATFGKAYVGIVGGARRHEFAILGPSVNLAARLMSSTENPGILVDDAIKSMANKRFDFLSHPPVRAKGYSSLVPIFEPQSEIERQWNKLSCFVGRETELKRLVGLAKTILSREKGKDNAAQANREKIERDKANSLLCLIQAHSSLGKSSLAMQAMDHIRRLGSHYKKEVTITKNVCKDGEQSVPFCVFRQIILRFLDERISRNEDDSAISGVTMFDLDDENYSLMEEPTYYYDDVYFHHIRELCKELNCSEGFAEMIGEKMLDLRINSKSSSAAAKLKPDEVVDFVTNVILKCTSQSDFVLFALDDVQWMDSLSWKVVEMLLRRGKDLMILCLSRPLSINTTTIDPILLRELQEDKCKGNKHCRFTNIELTPFTKNDVRALFAASIGCDGQQIDNELCDYIYEQTGGMPYFAQEMIRGVIQDDMIRWQDDGIVRWRSGLDSSPQQALRSSMNDLILHRLDHFNSEARLLLQVCAVLGHEFTLSELITVDCHCKERKQKCIQNIHDTLRKACKEKILLEIFQGGSTTKQRSSYCSNEEEDAVVVEKVDDRIYAFSHAVWRNCLLGTMLAERQRDLHRKIATILEGEETDKVVELRHAMKVFGHWRGSGNLMNSTRLALKIGQYLDGLLFNRQSMDFCIEALEMWKPAKLQNKDDTGLIADIDPNHLKNITADGLDCLARIHIAIAKNILLKDRKSAGDWFQKTDLILTRAPAVVDMKDRSVFFALYSGYFTLAQAGGIPIDADGKHVNKDELAKRLVIQARIHGDPVHIARAFAMEALCFANIGDFEQAIKRQNQLEDVYSAKELSSRTCQEYGSDRSAQSYGYSVLWYEVLGLHEEAQHQISFILDEIMPHMPPKNVHNSMMILFPVITVLKDKGMARKAGSIFRMYVYDRFYEYYGEGSSTFLLKIYEPLIIWLQLAGDLDEGGITNDLKRQEFEDFALRADVGAVDKTRSLQMCAMGRDLHCVVAETLWMLADKCSDGERKKLMLQKGIEQAKISSEYTSTDQGYEYARRQSVNILQKYSKAIVD